VEATLKNFDTIAESGDLSVRTSNDRDKKRKERLEKQDKKIPTHAQPKAPDHFFPKYLTSPNLFSLEV
jgi:hypothetical protein